jgi:hypothetical protein
VTVHGFPTTYDPIGPNATCIATLISNLKQIRISIYDDQVDGLWWVSHVPQGERGREFVYTKKLVSTKLPLASGPALKFEHTESILHDKM